MKPIRLFLTLISAVALAGGYAGSQIAALRGQASEWSSMVDQPGVAMAALMLFVLALIFACLREPEEAK